MGTLPGMLIGWRRIYMGGLRNLIGHSCSKFQGIALVFLIIGDCVSLKPLAELIHDDFAGSEAPECEDMVFFARC
jgi:hypothetical protein